MLKLFSVSVREKLHRHPVFDYLHFISHWTKVFTKLCFSHVRSALVCLTEWEMKFYLSNLTNFRLFMCGCSFFTTVIFLWLPQPSTPYIFVQDESISFTNVLHKITEQHLSLHTLVSIHFPMVNPICDRRRIKAQNEHEKLLRFTNFNNWVKSLLIYYTNVEREPNKFCWNSSMCMWLH